MSGIEILVSDHHGIYVPQVFVEQYNWSGINTDDIKLLDEGPDHDWYWESWDNVLRDAFHVDKEGHTWKLYQDGDLFAYCEELMTNEEYYNLFGEERNNG